MSLIGDLLLPQSTVVWPTEIAYSALIEDGYSSVGALATNATIALGWKPSAASSTPLIDMTGHYLITIRKVDSTITVWSGGSELAAYGGAIGSTYAELVNNVLTYYGGAEEGYYSRVAIVEDSLTWSSFWKSSVVVSGLYVPKNISDLTLHTLLDFSNNSDLGEDSSGNGNDWTLGGSPVQTSDTPTNNYCTLNPLVGPGVGFYAATYDEGNLWCDGNASNAANIRCTMSGTGKLYYESKLIATTAAGRWGVGLQDAFEFSDGFAGEDSYTIVYRNASDVRYNASSVVTGLSNPIVNDIVQVAFDTDTGNFWIGINNTWLNSGDPANGTNPLYTQSLGDYVIPAIMAIRNGDTHRLCLGSTDFSYTPPTGFNAFNTENIQENSYELSGSYTGNGSSDGPFINCGCALETLTIGSNTYDNDGTDNGVVYFLSNGFKMVSTTDNTSSASYNWTGTLKYDFKTSNAQEN